MPRQYQSSLYGPTGVGTRFEIAEDPRRIIPVRPGGMADQTIPAHLLGLQGSSYYYSNTQIAASVTPVQSGLQNLINMGGTFYSLGNPGNAVSAPVTLRLGGITGGYYDAIADGTSQPPPATIYTLDFPDGNIQRVMMVNGEVAFRATDTTGNYGAAVEAFPTHAGTVDTVTNGNAAIVGSGTAWNTQGLSNAGTLYGSYNASTPSQNPLRVGDLIRITQGAVKYWHRIVTITDATHMTIFPVWQGTTVASAAALDYSVWRGGYNSYSRAVKIYDSTSAKYYLYYAGGSGTTLDSYGSVECVAFDSTLGGQAHFMAPMTVDSAGVNVLNTKAVDVVLYKSFLLYGAGSAISWSVAGFPTSFTLGFGATDFPAINVSVIDTSDFFCSFEFIGDQLVAIFRDSIWLIQPTGSVPEFNFYRLPEAIGAEMIALSGLQVSGLSTRHRPSCSARNSVYYTSKEGLSKIVGGVSEGVSLPVVKTASDPLPSSPTVAATQSTWEPFTDTVLWNSGSKFALGWRVRDEEWFIQNITDTITGLQGVVRGMTGNICSSQDANARRYGVGYWHQSDGFIRFFHTTVGGPSVQHANVADWAWQTPIIILNDTYNEGFVMGGFQVEGRNLTAGSGVAWTMYAGRDPSAMTSYDTGNLAALADALPSRARVSKKCDLPFVGFVFTGALWAGVVGVNLYAAQLSAGSGK